MPPERETPYVSIKVLPQARAELRGATLALTSPAGRRVSMSDVLLAALHIAGQHEQEWIRLLTKTADTGVSGPPDPD